MRRDHTQLKSRIPVQYPKAVPAKERKYFTTKTFVAKKRHHTYSLLTAKAKLH
jgi:hypothetical protein